MKRKPLGIHTVVVVVPINDEDVLLTRCLDSLARAISDDSMDDRVRIEVVLVLDACTDDSADITRAFPFDVLVVDYNNVGMARSAGIQHALQKLESLDPACTWIANTDADSAVPRNWLSHQLALAGSGTDVMIGTVRPDPRDLTPQQQARWDSTHIPGVANGHVHGANLGCRADAYLAVGGFLPLVEHEDVGLVEQLRLVSTKFTATDACWVLTSGRLVGRTAGGYAGYLRDNLAPVE